MDSPFVGLSALDDRVAYALREATFRAFGHAVDAAIEAGAELLGTIPYDNAFTEAQIHRKTLLEHGNGRTAQAVRSIWIRVMERVLAAGAR